MRRLVRLGWIGAVALAAVSGSAGRVRAQCVACVQGCVSAGVGYASCQAGSIFGFQYCFGAGSCGWGDASGGSDLPPKLVRPHSAAAAAVAQVRVYELLFRCGADGRELLGPGEASRMLPGAAQPFTVHSVIGTLRRLTPGAADRLKVAAGLSVVGAGTFEGANVGPDGSGYFLRMIPEGAGIRTSVCSVRNETVVGPLAQATLVPGDLLAVKVSLEGSEYLCVLSPMPAPSGPPEEDNDAVGPRRAFLDEVGAAWSLHRERGFPIRFLPLPGNSCP